MIILHKQDSLGLVQGEHLQLFTVWIDTTTDVSYQVTLMFTD